MLTNPPGLDLKLTNCRSKYVFCSKVRRLLHFSLGAPYDDTNRVSKHQETREKTTNGQIVYFTKERVNRFVTLIISFIILVLLVIPIYALYRNGNRPDDGVANARCVGILLVATLLFSTVLSLFAKVKRHEILGASAA